MSCWSCHNPTGDALRCPACQALQPLPKESDPFAILGLPRRFGLDPGALERRFRELSLQVHADRFARAPPREHRIAVERSTALNDAHRTLRDPVRRAAHLLGLHGLPSDGDGTRPNLPPELLEEQLELREALLEAQAEGDSAATLALGQRVRAAREAALAELSARLDTRDETTPGPAELAAAATALARLRYCDRFLSEAEGDED